MIHEGPTLQLQAKLENQKQSVPITWCRYQILFPLKSSREPLQYIYFGSSAWAQTESWTDIEPKPIWQSTKLYIQMHWQSEMHMLHLTCTKPRQNQCLWTRARRTTCFNPKDCNSTQTWSWEPIWCWIYVKLWFLVKFPYPNRFMKCSSFSSLS